MKPVLFVRNDPVETFGVAPEAFTSVDAPVRVFDAIGGDDTPSLDDVSGVVMFGSAYNVDETDTYPFLKTIRDLTREALDREIPYLGVCLGAQVLTRAMDLPVTLAPVPEVGFEPVHPTAAAATDALLSHFRSGDMVFQWHRDTFDVPEGADLLATGDVIASQAYRLGDRTWGVQFHFEVDRAEIELWLRDYGEGLEDSWGKSAERIRDEVERFVGAHEQRGRRLFRRFADVAREHLG
jgi:GMP synthase-like glutamine amidotransferase